MKLDGPKSSRPLAVGESGRPLAKPPCQTQTDEGPGYMQKSNRVHPGVSKFSCSTKSKSIQNTSNGRPAKPASSDMGVTLGSGSTAFSESVPRKMETSALSHDSSNGVRRKQIRENRFEARNSRNQRKATARAHQRREVAEARSSGAGSRQVSGLTSNCRAIAAAEVPLGGILEERRRRCRSGEMPQARSQLLR